MIYIDPPFNTGKDSFKYNDRFTRSTWLTYMKNRLEVSKKLLSDHGSIFIHIDENQSHYLKVLCDEIFGRSNFVATVAIRSSTPSGVKTAHKNKKLIKQKDLMLVYKKSDKLIINPQYVRKVSYDTHFNFFADKEHGIVIPLLQILIEHGVLKKGDRLSDIEINNPRHRDFLIKHADNICQTQSFKNEEIKEASRAFVDRIYFVNKGENNETMFYNGRQLTPMRNSLNPVLHGDTISEELSVLLCDFWEDVDFQNTQHEGGVGFPNSKKPEFLIYRILSLFTRIGDLVLDSFLGSGTTAAVAHKMARRYIGVELGDHAYSLCQKRLVNVASGNDDRGISKALNWKGGGGFKFYELAPSLLKEDKFGNLVINKEYNADMLAAAMAKQEGFTYSPDADTYWKHGYSSETDFIYTTTQFMTAEGLSAIHETMGEDESLLICCTSFQRECRSAFPNITIKKIPQMLLGRCEFGKEDYSLNIIDMPQIEDFDEDLEKVDNVQGGQSDDMTLF